MTTPFKICRCCRTKAQPRKRVCNTCGVPAIWDAPNAEQVDEHNARRARTAALIEGLAA